MKTNTENYEEQCVTEKYPKRFEPQELDKRDYLHIEAEASAARGFLKIFSGGGLMALGVQMVRSSGVSEIIKPFFGSIIGTAGLVAVIDSFDDWETAKNKFLSYIGNRDHRAHKD